MGETRREERGGNGWKQAKEREEREEKEKKGSTPRSHRVNLERTLDIKQMQINRDALI